MCDYKHEPSHGYLHFIWHERWQNENANEGSVYILSITFEEGYTVMENHQWEKMVCKMGAIQQDTLRCFSMMFFRGNGILFLQVFSGHLWIDSLRTCSHGNSKNSLLDCFRGRTWKECQRDLSSFCSFPFHMGYVYFVCISACV